MIIEFELQGSKCLHKGILDTTGFWVKYAVDYDEFIDDTEPAILGYKIFSHFSFSYFHSDKSIVDLVFGKLISVLRGANGAEIEGIGFVRKLQK